MHKKCACMFMHTQSHKGILCTNSVTQDCRVRHTCAQSHTYTYTWLPTHQVAHTPTRGSKASSLPVACTMHRLDVRGCTSGRRGLAGRTPAGTDQDPPSLWPPLGMRSWCPTHSHFCSGPAGKQGPLTKPPWSVIGYKGGHIGHQGGLPKLSVF